jgi:hypothetical protein
VATEWVGADISLTVHSRAILKIIKSMCNGIKKVKRTFMKCHTNVNSTPPTQLPHTFSYIVAKLSTIILNHPVLFYYEGIKKNIYTSTCTVGSTEFRTPICMSLKKTI